MELWLDTIDFELIEKSTKLLNITGVTTNPTILSGSKLSAMDTINKLLKIQSGKVAVQVIANNFDDMVAEAKMIAAFDSRIIVKIPVNNNGLTAIKILAECGIKTMATAIFETRQVLLSAFAGATYAAPYFGRIKSDNYAVLSDMLDVIDSNNYPLKIIAAAIQNKEQIVNIAKLGSHAITIPSAPFLEFIDDLDLTTESLNQFANNWNNSGKSLNL